MRFPLGLSKIIALTKDLALIPGPSLQEGPRIEFLEKHFRALNFSPTQDTAGNLWLWLKEGPWQDTVVYDAHIDVVGRGGADSVREEGGKLIGAGVGDNLLTAATLAVLAENIRDSGEIPGRPLAILFSVGEEGLGNLKGMNQIVRDHPTAPRLLVCWDGGMNEYSISGLGSRRYRMTATGPGGHSWNDHGRPNSIETLAYMLVALKEAVEPFNGEQRRASFNIGTICGGEGINVIARHAEATFEFRSVDPALLAHLDSLVRRSTYENGEERTSLKAEVIGERPAAAATIPRDLLDEILDVWSELSIPIRPTVRSTNINLPLERGWKAVCLGLCRPGNTHREDEFVHLDSVEPGWEALLRLTTRLLQ